MTERGGNPNPCSEAIQQVVGNDAVHPAGAGDCVDGVCPQWVIAPGSAKELAQVLSIANGSGLRLIPRGGGTKLDWGNVPRGVDIILSTKRLDRVIEHAAGDMTATVQAGCTVSQFNHALAERGQRLALDPLWPESATIGGILATNDSGALRLAYGTLRDHLIGITVALADGTLARSGGKVVKNVAGYDLPKLFTGSFGTLGVVVEATFRLYPLTHASRILRFRAATSEMLSHILAALAECALVTSAVQIDAGADEFLVDILIEGLQGAIEAKVERATGAVIKNGGEKIGADEADAARSASRTEQRPTIRSADPTEAHSDVGRASPADQRDGGQCPPYTLDRSADPTEARSDVGRALPAEQRDGGQCPPYMRSRFLGSMREHLFLDSECIAKVSMLPTQIAPLLDYLRKPNPQIRWRMIAQSAGVGLLSLSGDSRALLHVINSTRSHLGSLGGSMVLLHCPLNLKCQIDVWGDVGNALPLMRQIKQHFDPHGILSPGRFVGGI